MRVATSPYFIEGQGGKGCACVLFWVVFSLHMYLLGFLDPRSVLQKCMVTSKQWQVMEIVAFASLSTS